ncbi:MAG: anaerobic ribonucleoside-triphosphate reductase activating protein [Candidatus Magasanikbacteria bacterium CG10_big_fil_rev_8_21_14_0_10_47_10]|uniref:Anaerobic ribonucleoside-triphosphate reductase activating protein n=1 Tax=Candidatus Magasanikbacteria bacterium CG10_big_fil_rev_8_21_14_0_10_47_10 TaxID=1974652 RepID=A0A2H0TPG7_9BACT|nr:MAG: anaerobic ribonucleoside-triphosphate reductase activating protein [Candidatus Magasanikbacteria bacterium CG10_big_fil_rev_8_21_14_0_10_47_10]
MRLSAVQRFTILDYPEHVACIAFTPGCQFRCGYCHNPEFVLPEKLKNLKSSFIPEESFFSFLDERKGKLDGVVVSGGEPTIHKDLPLFLQTIKDKGFLVKLDTNGNNPDVLSTLIEQDVVDYVAMDLKTALADYPRLVGPRVDTDKLRESVMILMNGTLPYEFRSTLVREFHTPDVIESMAQDIRGATKLFLQTFRPGITLNPAYGLYHPFTNDEMVQLQKKFSLFVDDVSIRT